MAQPQSTEVKVKVKTEGVKEEGAVKGSLGTLLASYGDSSSSDEETETGKSQTLSQNVPNPVFVVKSEPLEENPVYRPVGSAEVIVKQEPEVDGGSNVVTSANGSREADVGVVERMDVKQEPEDGDTGCNSNPVVSSATDFATLNSGGNKERVELELSVDDFFPSSEPYSEARTVKKEVDSGTSDSESDSEDSDSTENDDDEGVGGDVDPQGKQGNCKRKPEGPKVKGELSLYDLPPIEDLHISVPRDECKPIGVIKSVVEPLVIVEAYPETPALDLESVLFLEQGDRALGHIFDVIGPVKQPMYCVRFNSKEHIEKNKVGVGMPVYCAPKTPYTSYVFLAQLRRLRGSDASWLNDTEPPVEEVEYSDDEMERIAKKKKRNRKALRGRATEDDATYKEDGDTNGTNMRGRKRQHNYNNYNNGQQPGFYGGAPNMPSDSSGYPPFMPPMIPGFTPYGPHPGHAFPGHSNPRPWFPGGVNHMNPQRGFPRPRGGRGPPRFRPSFAGPSPGYGPGFQQNPYRYHQNSAVPQQHWDSWCPPVEWQNQNASNFNFGNAGQNPYPQMNGMQQPQHSRPPPPPPPPPPSPR